MSPIFGSTGRIIKEAVEALRYSIKPVAAKFLAVLEKVPIGDRDQLAADGLLEAVAVKSGVDPSELLGEMIFSFRSVQAQKSALMAMDNHPQVLQASLLYAMSPNGIQDRRMIHEAVGFVPTPKGMSLNLNFPQGTQPPERETSDDVSPDVNEVFPMISDHEQDWQSRRQKVLEAKN